MKDKTPLFNLATRVTSSRAMRVTGKRARKAAGISQEQVAELLGEHQSFVSRYETGERRLDVVEFLAVAAALDVDPAAHRASRSAGMQCFRGGRSIERTLFSSLVQE